MVWVKPCLHSSISSRIIENFYLRSFGPQMAPNEHRHYFRAPLYASIQEFRRRPMARRTWGVEVKLTYRDRVRVNEQLVGAICFELSVPSEWRSKCTFKLPTLFWSFFNFPTLLSRNSPVFDTFIGFVKFNKSVGKWSVSRRFY
jgi:hypothetical protein